LTGSRSRPKSYTDGMGLPISTAMATSPVGCNPRNIIGCFHNGTMSK
jgi:hypothetical protein